MISSVSSREDVGIDFKMPPHFIAEWKQSEDNSELKTTNTSELKPPLTRELQIIHAIPGRVRFRATSSNFKLISNSFLQHLRQQDGVNKVSFNQSTNSVIITFDINKISLSQILEVVQPFSINQIQDLRLKQSKTHSFVGWKLVSGWKQQGCNFVALLTGLLVTRALEVKNWAAIVTYLMTVGATSQVITKRDKKQVFLSKKTKKSVPSQSTPCSIIHQLPGRIRFNVPLIGEDLSYAQRLEKLLQADVHITNVRVNRHATSIVINYNPDVMSDSQLKEHLDYLIQSGHDPKLVLIAALACSLDIRQATVSSESCCLLKSKSGKQLYGGALAARSNRLQRIGVLV